MAWSQDDLAAKAGVSVPTVKRLEALDGSLGGRVATHDKILAALKGAGIEFFGENDGRIGVILKKRRAPKL